MISVISMLADPNSDSPANVDAAVSTTLIFHFSMGTSICRNIHAIVCSGTSRGEIWWYKQPTILNNVNMHCNVAYIGLLLGI